MPFRSFVHTNRPLLAKHIISFLEEKKTQSHGLFFYEDLLDKLIAFAPKGKLLRGMFVLFVANQYRGTKKQHNTEDDLHIAAAMELVQSALLIHDDIMDKDTIRRGEKTVFAQYEDRAQEQKIEDPNHYGESMGLCAGDTAFFFAFELISRIQRQDVFQELVRIFIQEIQMVSAAQMADMHYGLSSDEPSLRDIRIMYIRKTARYSFSLPFILGSIHGDAPKQDKDLLSRLGEYVGVVFQIKDDEIKLFGSEEEVGTDIGSDIRENKKTLIRAWLMERASESDRDQLQTIFGNNNLTSHQIDYVRKALYKYDIPAYIEQETNRLTKKAYEIISSLSMSEDGKILLQALVKYVVSRRK